MAEPLKPYPRVAIVVADKTYREMAGDGSRIELLSDPNSLVVPYSAKPDYQKDRVTTLRKHLAAHDLLTTDQLLVRNPYENSTYAFADDAIETFVKAKYYHLATIAAHLGASFIKFVKVEVQREESDNVSKGKANFKIVRGDGQFTRSIKNRLEGRFEAETALGGKVVELEAARAFMVERHLSTDPDVSGLIDLAATGNPVRKHRVRMNGLRESTQSFRAGLELTAKLGVELGGNGLFTRAAELISSIEVTTEITCPAG